MSPEFLFYSEPPGIDYGDDLSEPYNEGTEVILTGMPNNGSIFTGWSDGYSGTGKCVITMNADINVIATFDSSDGNQFELSVNKSGADSGVVTSQPSGINCGIDCSTSFNTLTHVILTAVPDSGSIFTGWSGDSCSGTEDCTVTVDTNRTVTAIFDKIYPATVQKGLIIDKKKAANKDKATIILTNCKGLTDAVAELESSSVHISIGPVDGEPIFERTIPGSSFNPNETSTKYKYKGKSPEKHVDILNPEEEIIKLKIKKAELAEILDPNAVTKIKVTVTVAGQTYEAVENCTVKDKPNKTKFIVQ